MWGVCCGGGGGGGERVIRWRKDKTKPSLSLMLLSRRIPFIIQQPNFSRKLNHIMFFN